MKKIILFFCILILFSFVSCTSSKGSSFDTAHQGIEKKNNTPEQSTTKKTISGKKSDFVSSSSGASDDALLSIDSNPENAQIFINGKYSGHTPLIIENLTADRYLIEIILKGYYKDSAIIDYTADGKQSVFFNLNPVTGYLSLSAQVPAEVFIAGVKYYTPLYNVPVPVGVYHLTINAFGYDPYYLDTEIEEEKLSDFSVELTKADFQGRNLKLKRNKINPRSAGPISNLNISFNVTAAGNGILKILDTQNNEVYYIDLNTFDTWIQNYTINKQYLSQLTDGEYTVSVELTGKDGNTGKLNTRFFIDSSLVVLPRTALQGVSGQLYSPDLQTLPSGSIHLSSFIAGHNESIAGDSVLFLPVNWSIRYGLPDNIEATISTTAVFLNDPDLATPFSVSVGAKKRFFSYSSLFNSGVYFVGTFGDNSNSDFFANFPGIHTGLPLELNLSQKGIPLGIIITPQVTASWRYPSYTTNQPDIDLYSWGYLKTSMYLDLGNFSTGLSCSLRSKPFHIGFDLAEQPMGIGAEFHYIPPETGFVFSAYAFGESDMDTGYYINGGAGVGIIF